MERQVIETKIIKNMKRVIKFLVGGVIVLGAQVATAQWPQERQAGKPATEEESRMNRDIAVAENVLSTLIKQEFSQRNFFPMEVRGSYRAGHGITFTIPTNVLRVWGVDNGAVVWGSGAGAYSYSFSTSPEPPDDEENETIAQAERNRAMAEVDKVNAEKERKAPKRDQERAENSLKSLRGLTSSRIGRTTDNSDSLQLITTGKIVQAAKNFILDYGDMLSQLKPDEKIIITNKDENQRLFYGQHEKRSILSVEALRADLMQYRQGKITRDQMFAKIKVVSTASSGKIEPDLELLTSIFNRLYESDLSKNFFIEGNAYYERLTDFGAIVYMQVYSSNQVGEGLFNMPTVNLREVDQATRDKKVKELYPAFESELKENILDYGRTIKSLKDTEQLVFDVQLTRCNGCGIPADIEVSVQNSVLRDYSSGKLDKSSALTKMNVKKGAGQ